MKANSSQEFRSRCPRAALPPRLLLPVLLLVAFGLRLYRLGAESLWYDETFSVYLAKQSLTELLAHTARDIHPPAYYAILHGWLAVSPAFPARGLEFMVSYASLFPGLLIVALVAALGQRLGDHQTGRRTALVAAALAAIHPPQVWISQEVRMYAWGAFFLLITLWALLEISRAIRRSSSPPSKTWTAYVASAVAACYTLYYAFFWLVIANIYILWELRTRRGRILRDWLLAQIAVILAYSPWLPIFVRQASDPPVPPWREPWRDIAEGIHDTAEALSALAVGHTSPFDSIWLSALPSVVVLLVLVGYAKCNLRSVLVAPLLYAFGPTVLLLVLAAFGKPIYHVRYVSLFAPAFPLVVAILVANAGPARRAAYAIAVVLGVLGLGGLRALWHSPAYAADDHRGAVAELASQWRPGDVVIVNAGWVYTAIDVYWPRQLVSPMDSLPPDLAAFRRLGDRPDHISAAPTVVRTGSIGATSNLGWGRPESDFFSMSASSAGSSIEDLAREHSRLWHYRLYDTVSDPSGVFRAALRRIAEPAVSRPFSGPGYLLLERYDIGHPVDLATPLTGHPVAAFAGGPTLRAAAIPTESSAGRLLYVELEWQGGGPLLFGSDLAVSLRAARGDGLVAQTDVSLPTLAPHGTVRQPVALAIPAGTPPGPMSVAMLLYQTSNLNPLAAGVSPESGGPEVTLGTVNLTLPSTPPPTPAPLASFDYIDLIAVDTTADPRALLLATRWIWLPRPSPYRDNYLASLTLLDLQRKQWAQWRFPLGGEIYPSGQWAPAYAVNQAELLNLPENVPPGEYVMSLGLERASDRRPIRLAGLWKWPSQTTLDVASVTIAAP